MLLSFSRYGVLFNTQILSLVPPLNANSTITFNTSKIYEKNVFKSFGVYGRKSKSEHMLNSFTKIEFYDPINNCVVILDSPILFSRPNSIFLIMLFSSFIICFKYTSEILWMNLFFDAWRFYYNCYHYWIRVLLLLLMHIIINSCNNVPCPFKSVRNTNPFIRGKLLQILIKNNENFSFGFLPAYINKFSVFTTFRNKFF